MIVHGYRGRPGWLDVGVALEDEQFVVTIEDEAPQFDPTGVPEPDLSVPPMRAGRAGWASTSFARRPMTSAIDRDPVAATY